MGDVAGKQHFPEASLVPRPRPSSGQPGWNAACFQGAVCLAAEGFSQCSPDGDRGSPRAHEVSRAWALDEGGEQDCLPREDAREGNEKG